MDRDIRLRAVTVDDPETLAHLLISAEQGAFRGLVPDQCLQFTEAQSAANWRKFFTAEGVPSGSDFMVIAETADGEAVGYVWGGVKDDGDGIVRQIHVLPSYQGRGIGRHLVSHVAERLAEKDIHRMTVEVLSVNPNRSFYERIGAAYFSESPYDWEGVPMVSCLYQWEDTRSLLNRPDVA
ncbi:MAG: GNAT family N-acetyltransferase [Chloroflexota bacterium]